MKRFRHLPVLLLLAAQPALAEGLAIIADSEAAVPPPSTPSAGPPLAPDVDLKQVVPSPADKTQEEAPGPAAVEEAPVAKKTELKRNGKFVILGAEVAPGTATRLAWSPDVGITTLELPTPVLVVNGKRKGKTLCLTSAIHGDELNGIEIVRRVMYDIDPKQLSGTVIGVPIVNLQGFQRGSRYLPDRRDLNRFFPGDLSGSLASRIAYSLFNEVISYCDLLIDLHTGSLRRNNLPQIRADMSNKDVARFTEGFDEMAVVHSPGSAGMLRYAAVQAGIPAVTLEAGESMRLQENQVKSGVKSINSALEREGMYSRIFSWGEPEPVYYKSRWLRATRGGILFSQAKLGDRVKKGDILGTVTDPITNEVVKIVSPERGRLIGIAVNQVVMPGFAAYHIGIEASEESLMKPGDEDEAPVDDIAANMLHEIDPEE